MATAADVIRYGAVSDAIYMGRFTRDLMDRDENSYGGPVVALAMIPYFSLFAHESLRKLETIDASLVSELSTTAKEIIARSRHTLKLFEDTKRGVSGQLSYYKSTLLPAHTNYFRGNTWFWPARILETDLGLSLYGGRLVGSTHTATFHMGADLKDSLRSDGGKFLNGLYVEYGSYFARLGAQLEGSATFVASLKESDFSSRDLRYSRYYRRVFNGPSTPPLNALLTTFRAMMNFVSLVLPANGDVSEYSFFKIRFLTLYQVLVSLRVLLSDHLQTLTVKSAAEIKKIVGNPTAGVILDRSAKPFRNSLMHYLDPRVDVARLNVSQPLFGLAAIYFPQYDFGAFSTLIDRCISETADALDAWAE